MKGKVRNFYAGGNTAKGYYSLYDSVIEELHRLFILKGGPNSSKSTLMRFIAETMENKGYDIEYLHCPLDNSLIDGVIFPTLKLGIVDGTPPRIIDPKVPGVIVEYVNVGATLDIQKLRTCNKEMNELTQEISSAFQTAYDTFAEALKRHDAIEKIYINKMNFDKANKLTEEFITLFFENQRSINEAKVRHSFLGAATPNGAVDFIQNLTEEIDKRYFIKGRAGSGKSTMLKKIANNAVKRGFDVEIYHCGFDPNSLDMLILPEQSIAIFDSTAPHEYFPDRQTDEIIDMYTSCIVPGTDEEYANEIKTATDRYKAKMVEGTSFLAKAKALQDQLEKYYLSAVEVSKLEQLRKEILAKIESDLS